MASLRRKLFLINEIKLEFLSVRVQLVYVLTEMRRDLVWLLGKFGEQSKCFSYVFPCSTNYPRRTSITRRCTPNYVYHSATATSKKSSLTSILTVCFFLVSRFVMKERIRSVCVKMVDGQSFSLMTLFHVTTSECLFIRR